MTRAHAGCAAVLVTALMCAGPAAAAPAKAPKPAKGTVEAQVLAVNDFHGALEPPGGSGGRIGTVPAGGIEFLAEHVRRLEATNRKATTVVSAGDLIGASPLLSALFHDEPTIEAMNLLGLDLNAVGNHEFDEGAAELRRMQEGGCHPEDGCLDGTGFGGADFRFLAANVVDERSGRTLFAPYAIRKVKDVRMAFVGMTLEGTPQIVSAAGVRGLSFRDEAATVNALVPELRRRGVETVVVLLHEGGLPALSPDGCPVSGPIVDIVERTSDEVDLFVTGHTHQAYDCLIDGRPVTSASSNGRLVTDIDLVLDRRTGEPRSISRNNRIITRDVPRDTRQSALIARYQRVAAPIAARVVGSTTDVIDRTPTAAGETALGDVIADAQLWATRASASGGAVAAFMNPGGIRADLDAGQTTYGELFSVQPFANNLVTLTLTGLQVERLLEQQFSVGRVLQVAGIRYAYDLSRPAGDVVDPARVTLGGELLDHARSYRITVNSFLADGGDGFTVLTEGTDRLVGAIDVEALEAYFAARSPIAPGPRDRIVRADAPAPAGAAGARGGASE